MIARSSCRGYFIHSLSTLYYYNAPSLATRLTGDYRDRTFTGKCGPASLDTHNKKSRLFQLKNRRHKCLKLFDFQFLFLCGQHFQKNFIYCVGVSSLYYEIIFQIDKRLYHSALLIIG
jgi:hypothetical protein